MPTYLRYLCVALASALAASHIVLWLAGPAPLERHVATIPPLKVDNGESLLIWGGWRTVAGYDHGTTNGVEIICNRAKQRCIEAYADLLYHDAGEDLAAQVFEYEVTRWDDERLQAIAKQAMAECVDRLIDVDLVGESATMTWRPGGEGCEGDTGKAVLVGDPL